MRKLCIECVSWLNVDGQRCFTAVVRGLDGPDPRVAGALAHRSRPWPWSRNIVEWNSVANFYGVSGKYDLNPKNGDCPSDLVRRVGEVVGHLNVSCNIVSYDIATDLP
jgi:hypothetical protein